MRNGCCSFYLTGLYIGKVGCTIIVKLWLLWPPYQFIQSCCWTFHHYTTDLVYIVQVSHLSVIWQYILQPINLKCSTCEFWIEESSDITCLLWVHNLPHPRKTWTRKCMLISLLFISHNQQAQFKHSRTHLLYSAVLANSAQTLGHNFHYQHARLIPDIWL